MLSTESGLRRLLPLLPRAEHHHGRKLELKMASGSKPTWAGSMPLFACSAFCQRFPSSHMFGKVFFAGCRLKTGHIVSMWGGRDGCVPGSGSGNQPVEALHALWQTRLKALGGKDISHTRLPSCRSYTPSIGHHGMTGTMTPQSTSKTRFATVSPYSMLFQSFHHLAFTKPVPRCLYMLVFACVKPSLH